MGQEDLVIHMFCLIDDQLKALALPRLRGRGPAPVLDDAETLAIVCSGELLGLHTDKHIFLTFRERFGHLFPALRRLHRTALVRQAANLWGLARQLQQRLAHAWIATRPEPPLWLVDSFPLPVCRYARAPSCKRLAGVAAFGHDPAARAVFYGLKGHLRVADCGVVAQLDWAPANDHDLDLAPELLPPDQVRLALADRNYWSPPLARELAHAGQQLLTPQRLKARDTTPVVSALLSKLRQPIEPVIGQLAERLEIKRTWARDLWHLTARTWRKLLAHTAAVLINARLGHPPTRLAMLFDP